MHPNATFKTDRYKSKGRPGVGGAKTGGDNKYSLILSNALTLIIPNCRLALPQKTKDRLAYVCQSGNETIDIL